MSFQQAQRSHKRFAITGRRLKVSFASIVKTRYYFDEQTSIPTFTKLLKIQLIAEMYKNAVQGNLILVFKDMFAAKP